MLYNPNEVVGLFQKSAQFTLGAAMVDFFMKNYFGLLWKHFAVRNQGEINYRNLVISYELKMLCVFCEKLNRLFFECSFLDLFVLFRAQSFSFLLALNGCVFCELSRILHRVKS